MDYFSVILPKLIVKGKISRKFVIGSLKMYSVQSYVFNTIDKAFRK